MSNDQPVVLRFAVQWGEMDALGHVNNARFFRWFESARIALLERIGVATTRDGASIGPILATTSCDFLRPVVYPAQLRVSVGVTRIGETSITMSYEVRDDAPGAGDEAALHARGSSVVVLVDYRDMSKVRVPDDVRAAIAAL